MKVAREHHAVCCIGDCVMVFGGLGENGGILDSVEMLNLNTGRWSIERQMPCPRSSHAICTNGSVIYLAGGRSTTPNIAGCGSVVRTVDVYDIRANKWSQLPSMLQDREHLALGVIAL